MSSNEDDLARAELETYSERTGDSTGTSQNNTGRADEKRLHAYVGGLRFNRDYKDPNVDVRRKFNVAEHDIITGSPGADAFAIQTMGRKPANITITGIIQAGQTDFADELGTNGPVYVRTERWKGTAMPTRVETTYRREKDGNSQWLHDITIELIEIAENVILEDAIVHQFLK